jgi:hypothetical protein
MRPIPQFQVGAKVWSDGVAYVIASINRQRVDDKIAYWLVPLKNGERCDGRHFEMEDHLTPYAEQDWDQEEV